MPRKKITDGNSANDAHGVDPLGDLFLNPPTHSLANTPDEPRRTPSSNAVDVSSTEPSAPKKRGRTKDSTKSKEGAEGADKAASTKAKSAKAKSSSEVFAYTYPIDPKSNIVCGIDEAGRGPLMGDVVAGCVILDYEHMIEGLNDSKKLTEAARDRLAPLIKEQAIAWGVGRASPREIDELNILNATYLAMRRAFDDMMVRFNQKLAQQGFDSSEGKVVNLALVDGNRIPKTFSDIPMVIEAVVKGDSKVAEISAASILAKTTRDADLYELDKQYPEYGFASHKGYPTKAHLDILEKLPLLDCYRRSYGPVRKILEAREGATNISTSSSPKASKKSVNNQRPVTYDEFRLISIDDDRLDL